MSRIINNSALDAVIMMNIDGNVEYWNPAAESMFGYRHDEIMGKNVHAAIMPEKYRSRYEKGITRFKDTGEGDAVGKLLELTGRRKDGTQFPMEIVVSPIRLKGQPWASAIIRDISDRWRVEQAFKKSVKKFNDLFNKMSAGVVFCKAISQQH